MSRSAGIIRAAIAAAVAGIVILAGAAPAVSGTNGGGGNGGAGTGGSGGGQGGPKNPCKVPEIRKQRGLLCPDLRMSPPYDLEQDKTPSGTPVLRGANSINSVGDGPAELHGERSGHRTMKAVQRIHKKHGRSATFETHAELYFKPIPDQGSYWKFKDAARMELWLLGPDGARERLVEVGPKQIYCLRDLFHTNPDLPHSPSSEVYPACNQDPGRQEVTLGTSVGWSDVYPYSYHEQYVKINHIPHRACYAFVHIADPKNGIYELDEENNEASTTVYLTERGRYLPGRCEGVYDQGVPQAQAADDTEVHSEGDEGY